MVFIDLGPCDSFTHSRYTITLSPEKRLVLFRLPCIQSNELQSGATPHLSNQWVYYCMEAECPHAGGPMSRSIVQYDVEDSSYIASCPWHSYDFDLQTGTSSYGLKACTFEVDVRGDHIYLDIATPPSAKEYTLVQKEPINEQYTPKKSSGANANTVVPNISAVGELSTPALISPESLLCEWCVLILNTPDPEAKIFLTRHLFNLFTSREHSSYPMKIGEGLFTPPGEPLRTNLRIIDPHQMHKIGRGGSVKSRIAILHSLANIEQWAIDLAIDICVRFASFKSLETATKQSRGLPRTFFGDWLKVANDEAKHFSLLRGRLEELETSFGALPVHHGLWESAAITSHDLRARISIIALVHEARGLDVNPLTIDKFRKAGDAESVQTLTTIHNDEITHVTTGHRWLTWICEQEGTNAVEVFRDNVGAVKGPFNTEAREQAGLEQRYYQDLAGRPKNVVVAGG